MIVAIDPGTTHSAYVAWDGTVIDSGFVPNEVLLTFFSARVEFLTCDQIAIEMIASYGMPVGKEVFETCVWIGRFIERCRKPTRLVYRKDVKMHLCYSTQAKDANVNQALRDKHGCKGTKKNPGKLYGISGHLWAALAVADYAFETLTIPQ